MILKNSDFHVSINDRPKYRKPDPYKATATDFLFAGRVILRLRQGPCRMCTDPAGDQIRRENILSLQISETRIGSSRRVLEPALCQDKKSFHNSCFHSYCSSYTIYHPVPDWSSTTITLSLMSPRSWTVRHDQHTVTVNDAISRFFSDSFGENVKDRRWTGSQTKAPSHGCLPGGKASSRHASMVFTRDNAQRCILPSHT